MKKLKQLRRESKEIKILLKEATKTKEFKETLRVMRKNVKILV